MTLQRWLHWVLIAVLVGVSRLVAQPVTWVSAGDNNTVFLKADGTLWATGEGAFYGADGEAEREFQPKPVRIATGVIAAQAGEKCVVFQKSDKSLWLLGQFSDDGTSVDELKTLEPLRLATKVRWFATDGMRLLFLRSDDSLWRMGWRSSDEEFVAKPQKLRKDVKAASLTPRYLLAIRKDGALMAALAASNVPVKWTKVGKAKSFADGACYLDEKSALWFVSEIGTDTTVVWETKRVAESVVSAATGGHLMFIKKDGTLWGRGENDRGQLGDGTRTERNTPVKVANRVVAVYVNQGRTAFLKDDGKLWVMGANDRGQLGDGTFEDRTRPVRVATSVAHVAIGREHMAILRKNGELLTVGGARNGQLGNGQVGEGAKRAKPVHIAGNKKPSVLTSAGAVRLSKANKNYTLDADMQVWSKSGKLSQATLTISKNLRAKDDRLVFVANPSQMGDISGTYSKSKGKLTLKSASGGATVAQWQKALRSVKFQTANRGSKVREVTIAVYDGSAKSAKSTRLVDRPPKISELKALTFSLGDTARLKFKVSDGETAAKSLVAWATLAKESPLHGKVIDAKGTGATRVLTLTAWKRGTAKLNVHVSDGILSTTKTIKVTVK